MLEGSPPELKGEKTKFRASMETHVSARLVTYMRGSDFVIPSLLAHVKRSTNLARYR